MSHSNAFATLGLEPAPLVDEDALHARFEQISRETHPDAHGDADRFAEANAAFSAVRNPASRLRHLLEIYAADFGVSWRTGEVPMELIKVFMQIGPFLQRCDDYLTKQENASSRLAKALLAKEATEVRQELGRLQGQLQTLRASADKRLASLGESSLWKNEAGLRQIAQLYQEYSFLDKWEAQVASRAFKLQL